MLTMQDCLANCDLPEDVVNVIAHHKHQYGLAAISFANHLIRSDDGEQKVCDILADELRHSGSMGGSRHVRSVLEEYLQQYPECRASIR